MPLDESAIVYARLCELATQMHRPDAMAELRRLGAIHRWEYDRLPFWIREAAGLKESGIAPETKGQ